MVRYADPTHRPLDVGPASNAPHRTFSGTVTYFSALHLDRGGPVGPASLLATPARLCMTGMVAHEALWYAPIFATAGLARADSFLGRFEMTYRRSCA